MFCVLWLPNQRQEKWAADERRYADQTNFELGGHKPPILANEDELLQPVSFR
jgi:hypothetical protein